MCHTPDGNDDFKVKSEQAEFWMLDSKQKKHSQTKQTFQDESCAFLINTIDSTHVLWPGVCHGSLGGTSAFTRLREK